MKLRELSHSVKVTQLISREVGVKRRSFCLQTCGFTIALQCTWYTGVLHLFYILTQIMFILFSAKLVNTYAASWRRLLRCNNPLLCFCRSRATMKLKDKFTIWKIASHSPSFFLQLGNLGINPLNFGFLVDRN